VTLSFVIYSIWLRIAANRNLFSEKVTLRLCLYAIRDRSRKARRDSRPPQTNSPSSRLSVPRRRFNAGNRETFTPSGKRSIISSRPPYGLSLCARRSSYDDIAAARSTAPPLKCVLTGPQTMLFSRGAEGFGGRDYVRRFGTWTSAYRGQIARWPKRLGPPRHSSSRSHAPSANCPEAGSRAHPRTCCRIPSYSAAA